MKQFARAASVAVLVAAGALVLGHHSVSASPSIAVDLPNAPVQQVCVQNYLVDNGQSVTIPMPLNTCLDVTAVTDFNDVTCAFFKGIAMPTNMAPLTAPFASAPGRCVYCAAGIDAGGAFANRLLTEPSGAVVLDLGHGVQIVGNGGITCRLQVNNNNTGFADALICIAQGPPLPNGFPAQAATNGVSPTE